MPIETTTETPTETRQRCRTLRPSGHQCRAAALRGHDHCFFHGRDSRRLRNVKYSPAVIEIPLLDNHAAIQVVCTDVARALAAGTLDINIARQIGVTVGIALRTLPRLAAPATGSKKEESAAPEPVAEIVLTPEGEEIAPETEYHGSNGRQERVWSLSEYLYRKAFPRQAGEPLPEEGYIDPAKGSILPSQPQPGEPDPLHLQPLKRIQPNPPSPAPDRNPESSHQPTPGILPELQAQKQSRMKCLHGQKHTWHSTGGGAVMVPLIGWRMEFPKQ
jgi:hypothetical protein